MKKVTQYIIKHVPDVPAVLDGMKRLLADIESGTLTRPTGKNIGLCSNLERYVSTRQLVQVMEYWPNHSGDMEYPVKSGKSTVTPKEMYQDNTRLKSKYIGAYGKRRINLLKWLIKQFEIAVVEINKL